MTRYVDGYILPVPLDKLDAKQREHDEGLSVTAALRQGAVMSLLTPLFLNSR